MAVNPQIKNLEIRPPKAPNLLIAPVSYSQLYIDQLNNALRLYFAQIDNFSQAIAIPLSGTTANRPLDNIQSPLPVGKSYFDTTLGYPIWWDGADWVDATGTVV